jgi:hypothetical protein
VHYIWLKASLLLFIGGGNKYLLMRGQTTTHTGI